MRGTQSRIVAGLMMSTALTGVGCSQEADAVAVRSTDSAPASDAGPAPTELMSPLNRQAGPDATLGTVDLRSLGYTQVSDREMTGAAGNPVYLQHYVGDVTDRPSPTGIGRDSVHVNAAYVAGLGELVDADVGNLAIPRGASIDGELIAIGERKGLLVDEGIGRWVAFTIDDWRIQVSTDAPSVGLTDAQLIAIAVQVELH